MEQSFESVKGFSDLQDLGAVHDESMVDLIFSGGSPSTSPEDIEKIKTPTPKQETPTPEKKVEETPEEVLLTAEDILGTPEETTAEETTSTTQEETSNEDNTFQVLAEELIDLNIFTKTEDETPITNAEEFKERFLKEINTQSQNQIYNFLRSKHGDEGVEAFEAMFVHGVSPAEYAEKYAELEAVKDLDINIESNQEQVYREYYRRAGLSQEKIEAKLTKVKEYGDLADEAKDLHTLLVNDEEKEMQEMIENQKLQQQAILQRRQEYHANLSRILQEKLKQKEFDGIPVTDKTARETFDFLYTEKYQLPDGSKLTEFDRYILELRKPENHEKKIKMALLMKSDLDLTKVQQKAISKKSDDLFHKLASKDKNIKRSSSIPPAKNFFEA